MNKTEMPMDPEHAKVVTIKGKCNPVAPLSGEKSQLTVVACVNAVWSFTLPMVIPDHKTLPPQFMEGSRWHICIRLGQ